jgi:cation diffusion facilitator CzcD-associated flavoprotein CzcO
VGGTWYWNRYPGARCDSESHSYCYYSPTSCCRNGSGPSAIPASRDPALPEPRADRLDLKRDIRFGTRVTAARYDEALNRWRVTTEAATRFTAHPS